MKIWLCVCAIVCGSIVGFFLSLSFCIAWAKLSYCLEGEDKRVNDNCVSYGDSDNGQCQLLCYGYNSTSDPMGYEALQVGCWATIVSTAGLVGLITILCCVAHKYD
jgi:hypothetical protein